MKNVPLHFLFADLVGEVNEYGYTNRPVQVFRTGKWHHPVYGEVNITPEDLDKIQRNFERYNMAGVAVADYEHGSDLANGDPDRSLAAGWIQKLIRTSRDTIHAVVKWTDKAASHIRNQEYRFISPSFVRDYHHPEDNKKVGPFLKAIALTNRPFIKGMAAVALSEEAAHALNHPTEDDSMEFIEITFGENTFRVAKDDAEKTKAFVKALQDAKDEATTKFNETTTKFNEVVTERDGLKEKVAKFNETGDQAIVSLREANEAMKVKLNEVTEQYNEVSKTLKQTQADTMVKDAMESGKLSKAEVDAWGRTMAFSDPATFKTIVDTKAPSVPMGEKGRNARDGMTLSDSEKAVRFNDLVSERYDALAKKTPSVSEATLYRQALDQVAKENPDLAV